MIPLSIKLSYTFFAVITVAVYSVKYGFRNFLWFSDIAMVATVPALWFESSLLASMMTLGILLPEVFWNVAYFGRLVTGKRIAGLTDYMFDRQKPIYLRSLSLFHVFLPLLLLWMIARLGYAQNALTAQTILAWIVLLLTYWLSSPNENINWVYGPGTKQQKRMSQRSYLVLVMIFFPVCVYFPTHVLLKMLFR